MKQYKKYVLGGVFVCLVAVALMTPVGKSEAFWPFGKAKKENNSNYTGTVKNIEILPKSSITVISPNGGETLQGGKQYTIKWKSKGISKKAGISIILEEMHEAGMVSSIIAITTNKGSYKWMVPSDKSSLYTFKIMLKVDRPYFSSDASDGEFKIIGRTQDLSVKVIQGEQPLATIFPKTSMLPFNNFIIDPQGKQITLNSVTVFGTGILDGKHLEVALVIKKLNGGDEESVNFYEGKTIATGIINGTNELRLIPNNEVFSFNYPVEFSIVGIRGGSYYAEDGLIDGSVVSLGISGVEATDLKTNSKLFGIGLPIGGTKHTINNSFKVGVVNYQDLVDSNNKEYLFVEVLKDGSEDVILKNIYFEVGPYWDINKETLVTIKNNNNNSTDNFNCSVVINGMIKCSFEKGVVIYRGSSLNITVNQKGGTTPVQWFDFITTGYAYNYRLYPQTARACFLAGTKIDIADGSRKNIEEIKIGDYVKSLNIETRKTNNAKVVKVIKKIDPAHLTINNSLKTVPDQKMFTKEGFKQAQDLKIGDYLLSNDDNWIKISDISPIVNESVETYDLVLDGGNTFYADGYLAHSVIE